MLHKSVYFASLPDKSYTYYWMLQWNFFGICHPDDAGSRFFGNVGTHLPGYTAFISHKHGYTWN